MSETVVHTLIHPKVRDDLIDEIGKRHVYAPKYVCGVVFRDAAEPASLKMCIAALPCPEHVDQPDPPSREEQMKAKFETEIANLREELSNSYAAHGSDIDRDEESTTQHAECIEYLAELITTLAACLERSEAENFALAAAQCKEPVSGEFGDMLCAKNLRLRLECDEVHEMEKDALKQRDQWIEAYCELHAQMAQMQPAGLAKLQGNLQLVQDENRRLKRELADAARASVPVKTVAKPPKNVALACNVLPGSTVNGFCADGSPCPCMNCRKTRELRYDKGTSL